MKRRASVDDAPRIAVRLLEVSAVFQSFWHGAEPPPFVGLCMSSFLERGERFTLYSYRKVPVPFGVQLRDASEILPQSDVFYYRNPDGSRRSVAAFANLFRYKLLEKRGGWWVDTDVLRLDGPLPTDDFVVGWEDDLFVCNAIIKAPPAHPLLVEADKRACSAGTDLSWGQTGPRLITTLVAEMGLAEAVKAPGVVYPTRPHQFAMVVTPSGKPQLAEMTEEAPFLHLWHEMFRINGDGRLADPEPHSFLAERYASLGSAFRRMRRGARLSLATLRNAVGLQ